MRFFRSRVLFIAATGILTVGGSLALSGAAAPVGASPVGITVNCPADNLEGAIESAPAGSTLLVSGTCTGNSFGNFYINKDLTLTGPAILDGSVYPTTTLNVAAGNVVLNNLVIQGGVGISNIGGGVWNSGQLTLNHSTVSHNTTGEAGGVFNVGQLTLNNSSVSDNTATNGTGGIFNCGGNPGFEHYGLCTGAPSLILNNSSVSNNVGGPGGDGGGIDNDLQAALTLNDSTVSGNSTGGSGNGGGIDNQGTATLKFSNVSGNSTAGSGNGGGIENQGTATLRFSNVSGNVGGAGGGINNNGTATISTSILSNNSSIGGSACLCGGGGLSNGLSNTGTTTINYSIIRANNSVFVGGGIFAGGGPININNSIVTGNSAAATGGGMIVWDGPTTVANSVFSHNSDQGTPIADTLPGVVVAPNDYLGLGNIPTFTTTHSTYH